MTLILTRFSLPAVNGLVKAFWAAEACCGNQCYPLQKHQGTSASPSPGAGVCSPHLHHSLELQFF